MASDTLVSFEDLIHGASRGGQMTPRGVGADMPREVIPNRLWARGAPQAFGRMISDLKDQACDALIDALRRLFACSRKALGHLMPGQGIAHRAACKTFLPFLDEAFRAPYGLGQLLLAPVGMLLQHTKEIHPIRVVGYRHGGLSFEKLNDLLSFKSVPPFDLDVCTFSD